MGGGPSGARPESPGRAGVWRGQGSQAQLRTGKKPDSSRLLAPAFPSVDGLGPRRPSRRPPLAWCATPPVPLAPSGHARSRAALCTGTRALGELRALARSMAFRFLGPRRSGPRLALLRRYRALLLGNSGPFASFFWGSGWADSQGCGCAFPNARSPPTAYADARELGWALRGCLGAASAAAGARTLTPKGNRSSNQAEGVGGGAVSPC